MSGYDMSLPRASSCEGIPETPHPGGILIKWLNHLGWLLLLWRDSRPWSRKLVSSPIKTVLKKKVLSQSLENCESCYPFLVTRNSIDWVSQTEDSTALNWSLQFLFCSSAFVSSPYWHMNQSSTCCTFWLECVSCSLRSSHLNKVQHLQGGGVGELHSLISVLAGSTGAKWLSAFDLSKIVPRGFFGS